ncbi:glycosyltransferase family 4 protein [Rheinheimera texasensis]|uniref:glycosyltransferase family 4 protein n=1 Tax=Rheinheimera texasensis TaxID=306205 RepID=UPI0032B28A55
MKILYIVTRGDVIGGASMHVLELASEMQRRGCDVTILLGPGDIVAQLAQQRGLSIIVEPLLLRQISPMQDLRCFIRLSRLLRQLRPDVLHLHSAKAGLLGRVVAKLQRVPVIYSVHGWSFSMYQGKKARCFRWLERLLMPLTDQLVLVCQRDFNIARNLLGAKPAQLALVHNGIAECATLPKATDPSCCRLISVARFEDPKDQITLLKAMAGVAAQSWCLKLVGSGPTLQCCRQLAQELGLEQVEFLGERSDVVELLAQSDVFVLSSLSESLPVSVIEAMRAGLPVVATNVGGMAEMVADDLNGYLVAPQDVSHLGQCLGKLIAEPGLRQRMGAEARSRFEQFFTLHQNSTRILTLYRQLLETA